MRAVAAGTEAPGGRAGLVDRVATGTWHQAAWCGACGGLGSAAWTHHWWGNSHSQGAAPPTLVGLAVFWAVPTAQGSRVRPWQLCLRLTDEV